MRERAEQEEREERMDSTLSALLRDKPRRGRPRRAVSRQNVYVALSDEQKAHMTELGRRLPAGFKRADVPDLAVSVLVVRFEAMRRAVAGRTQEMPEGITDLNSLYLLWDLSLERPGAELNWTSIRLSPQQAVELGRMHGTLNALFSSNRSDVFALGLAALDHCLEHDLPEKSYRSLTELREELNRIYL